MHFSWTGWKHNWLGLRIYISNKKRPTSFPEEPLPWRMNLYFSVRPPTRDNNLMLLINNRLWMNRQMLQLEEMWRRGRKLIQSTTYNNVKTLKITNRTFRPPTFSCSSRLDSWNQLWTLKPRGLTWELPPAGSLEIDVQPFPLVDVPEETAQ